MNKYLLLRDNKQSGPYALEELVQKGLKPYDLVWLEGKSAAWRYPSEFDELKPFSPVVEEQPYDRFYKRGGEQTDTGFTSILEQRAAARARKEAAIAEAEAAKKKEAQQTVFEATQVNTPIHTEPVTEEPVMEVPPAFRQNTSKNIHVTMPATANRSANTNTVNGQYAVKDDTQKQTTKKDYKRFEPVPVDQQPVSNDTVQEPEVKQAVTTNDRFESAASGGVRGNGLIAETSEQAPYITAPKKDSRKLMMRSLVAACLVLGGIVIGLAISYYHNRTNTDELERLVKQITERQQQGTFTETKQPVEETANTVAPPTDSIVNDAENVPEDHIEFKQVPVNEPAGRQKATELAKKESTSPVGSRTATPVVSTREDVRVTPTVMDNTQEKEKPAYPSATVESARKNIYSLVDVSSNKFKVGVLGGISELYLTVSNNSQFALDQVAVEVKYFGPEKKLVKTQTMVFNDVAPGEQKTLEVPRSNRGVSLDYTITHINSKVLGLAQARF